MAANDEQSVPTGAPAPAPTMAQEDRHAESRPVPTLLELTMDRFEQIAGRHPRGREIEHVIGQAMRIARQNDANLRHMNEHLASVQMILMEREGTNRDLMDQVFYVNNQFGYQFDRARYWRRQYRRAQAAIRGYNIPFRMDPDWQDSAERAEWSNEFVNSESDASSGSPSYSEDEEH